MMRHFSQVASKLRYGSIKFDFKNLKEILPYHIQNIKNRSANANAQRTVDLWELYKTQLHDLEMLRKKRNLHSEKKPLSEDEKAEHKKLARVHKQEVATQEANLEKLENELMEEALKIPNLTHPDVPIGDQPHQLALHGKIPKFDFKIKDHLELGALHNLFDFDSAAKITNSKFVYLKNEAALIELGLINWAMQNVVKKGFTPITTPDICKQEIASGCGFQPRDPSGQMYNLADNKLCLIGTAEISIAGMFAETVINADKLPMKYAGFSHCFRMEAGRGQVSKGLYRLHQFSKVEMFAFTTPEESDKTHEEMLSIEIELLNSLKLPFRVLDMPSTDLGASAYRKYDIEIWMPSREDWGEVTSTSNCRDYQALRLNSFYLDKSGEKKHVHTVNGTACAVPRVLLGLLEHGQKKDGTIELPECLHKYVGFSHISPLNKA
ncbi:SERS [Blepharisma stoltei]|uniref:serine--tRNA ligase n=1 Tax=Blepharisma stoltei TaxID=1481888 RepID=A0AAU9JKJ2_9CILI|nr:unnamed protein product [Blepharisma stoltei]